MFDYKNSQVSEVVVSVGTGTVCLGVVFIVGTADVVLGFEVLKYKKKYY